MMAASHPELSFDLHLNPLLNTSLTSRETIPEDYDMMVSLTEKQVSILLGVRLMYTAVPFHRTTKRGFDVREMRVVDGFRESLLGARAAMRRDNQQPTIVVSASPEELGTYCEMTRACLDECRGSSNELWCHLGSVDETEVSDFVAYLEGIQY